MHQPFPAPRYGHVSCGISPASTGHTQPHRAAAYPADPTIPMTPRSVRNMRRPATGRRSIAETETPLFRGHRPVLYFPCQFGHRRRGLNPDHRSGRPAAKVGIVPTHHYTGSGQQSQAGLHTGCGPPRNIVLIIYTASPTLILQSPLASPSIQQGGGGPPRNM